MRHLSFLLFFIFCFLHAQEPLQPVSIEDLSATQSTQYPAAYGEILYQNYAYEVQYISSRKLFDLNKKITKRIKVYDKDQLPNKYLTVKVDLYEYASHNKDKIYDVEAFTYNLVDGKIKKEKVDKDAFYKSNISENKNQLSFTFPNVQNGSIIEYTLVINSPDISYTGKVYLQDELPVNYVSFSFSTPDFMQYSRDTRGTETPKFTTEKKNGLDYNTVIDNHELRDLPPIKNEPFVLNPNNIKSSVEYELVMMRALNGIIHDFSNSWDKIAKDLLGVDYYKNEMDGVSNLQKITDEIIKGKTSEVEKCNAALKWIQDNIKWNHYIGIYPKNGVRKALKEKEGNVADLNLMLINILRKANVKTYPVLVSTLDNGILNLTPSKRKVNYLIAAAEINNNFYLMDATYINSEIGMIPLRARNHNGILLISEKNVPAIDLFASRPSKGTRALQMEVKEGKLVGLFQETKTDFYALNDINERHHNIENFEKEYLDYFKVSKSDYKYVSKGMGVRHRFNFEDDKNIQTIGNKMIIKPFSFISEEQFNLSSNLKERKFPVEFPTSFIDTNIAYLKIPEGYMIGELPENKLIKLDESMGGYSISFEKVNDLIKITSVIAINQSRLDAHFFKPIKNLFEEKATNENIELIFVKK